MVGSCVFCAPQSVGKCFGFIHSQPADYSGALVLVCVRNSLLMCASGCISIHIYVCPLPPRVGLQSLLPALLPPPSLESLQFKSLIFHSDCTNISRGVGRGAGVAFTTWTNQQTPGVLLGYHYGSTSLYTSCLDQNKAGHFR